MPEFKAPKFRPASIGGSYGGISDALNEVFAIQAAKKQEQAIERGKKKSGEIIKANPAQRHDLSPYESKDPVGAIERNVMYKRLRAANQSTLTARIQGDFAETQDLLTAAADNTERAKIYANFDNKMVERIKGADVDSIVAVQPLITRAQSQLAVLSESQNRKQIHRETSITVIGNLTKDADVGFSEDNPGALGRLKDAFKDKFITVGQFVAFQNKLVESTFAVSNVAPLFESNIKPEAVFDPKNPDGLFMTYEKNRQNAIKEGVGEDLLPDNLKDWVVAGAAELGARTAEEQRDLIQGAKTLDEALSIVYGETEEIFQKVRDDVFKFTKNEQLANDVEKNTRAVFRDKTAAILQKLRYEDAANRAKAKSAKTAQVTNAVRVLDDNIIDVDEGGNRLINLISEDDLHLIIAEGNESQKKKALATAKFYDELGRLGDYETREDAVDFISNSVASFLEDMPDSSDEEVSQHLRETFGFSKETTDIFGNAFGRLRKGSVQQLIPILRGESRPQITPAMISQALAQKTFEMGPAASNKSAQAAMVAGSIPAIYQDISGGDNSIRLNASQAEQILSSMEAPDLRTYLDAVGKLAPITEGSQKINVLSYLNTTVDLIDDSADRQNRVRIPTKADISTVSQRIKTNNIQTDVRGKDAFLAHVSFLFANTDKTLDKTGGLEKDKLGAIIDDVNDSNVVQFTVDNWGWWNDDDNSGRRIYVPNVSTENGDVIDKEETAMYIMAATMKKESKYRNQSTEDLLPLAEKLLIGGSYFEAQADGTFRVYSVDGTEVPSENRRYKVVTRREILELHKGDK